MIKKMRIRTKLAAVLFAFGLIPLITSGYFSYHMARKSIVREIKRHFSIIPDTAVSGINQLLYYRYNDILVYSRLPLMRTRGQNERKSRFFEFIKSDYPSYAWIGFADESGKVVATSDSESIGINIGTEEGFGKAEKVALATGDNKAREAFFEKPHISDKAGGVAVVGFFAPVFDDNGRFTGIIHAEIKMSAVATHIAEVSIPEGNVFLISNENLILADHHGARTDLTHSISEISGLEDLIKSARENEIVLSDWHVALLSELRGYLNYPGMGWKILVVQNRKDAFKNAETIAWFFTGLTILGSAGFVLLGFLLARGITIPVEKIYGFIKEIEDDYDISATDYKTNNEIDILEVTVKNVFERLREKEEKLLDAQSNLEEINEELQRRNLNLQEEREKLFAFNSLLYEIVKYLPLAQLSKIFLDKIFTYTGCTRGGIFYQNGENNRLFLTAEGKKNSPIPRAVDSLGIDNKLIDELRSVFIEKDKIDPEGATAAIFGVHLPDKVLCVPVIGAELQTKGFIVLGDNGMGAGAMEFVNFASFLLGVGMERIESEEKLRTMTEALRRKSEELERQNVKLIEIDKVRTEFISLISHELRTPLNSIIGFSEILLDSIAGKLNHKQKECVKDILESGLHLLQIVNDILDLSKIEAGNIELEIETTDIEIELKNSLRTVAPLALNKGQKIITDIENGIRAVNADRGKLNQILLNLLSNAIKFSPEKSDIKITVRRDGDNLLFAVADKGIGINEKDMARLFKPFVQVDSSFTRRYEGTGLGLAICRKLIEAMAGRIWVESSPGRGSTFFFTIKAAEAEDNSDVRENERHKCTFFECLEDESGLKRLDISCSSNQIALLELDEKASGEFIDRLDRCGVKATLIDDDDAIGKLASISAQDRAPFQLLHAQMGDDELKYAVNKALKDENILFFILTREQKCNACTKTSDREYAIKIAGKSLNEVKESISEIIVKRRESDRS